MVIDETIADLKAGKLAIDCIDMALTQVADERPITFRGKGYIRQDEEGVFRFKIYAQEVDNTDHFKTLERHLQGQSGTIVERQEYYSLVATDMAGKAWAATDLLPDCSWGSGGAVVVSGTIALLTTCYQTSLGAGGLRVHFFDSADIPCSHSTKTESNDRTSYSRDRSNFVIGDRQFQFLKLDDEFIVEITPSGEFPMIYPWFVQQAMRFILATSVTWRACLRIEGGQTHFELRSPIAKSAKVRQDPPLQRIQYIYPTQSIRMFSNYLSYIERNGNASKGSMLSYHLHNACEASANSVDAWAIGLGVAVEALASLIEKPADTALERRAAAAKARHLAAFKKSAMGAVTGRSEFEALAKRLEGFLNGMSHVRPRDRLEPLVGTGHVNVDHLRAWSKMRNSHVHPTVREARDDGGSAMQDKLDLISKTTVLLYHIVFFIIGYEGEYSDYAVHGWPIGTYPLQRAVAP